MKKYPFKTAYMQTRELYGLELNPDEFESLGLTAWNRIGNKDCRLYNYTTIPLKDEMDQYYVDLPCNVDIIEAVTTNYEDYQKTTPTTVAGNNQNGWIEGYIESRKYNTGTLYAPGKFIKYREEDGKLILSNKFDIVNILYKGVIVDDEGLPLISEREIDAIAIFCTYTDMFKRALVTKDGASMQLAQILEQKWKLLCTQARVPEYINQNEMDEILNVMTSWDRKRYGRSFKPIR